MDDYRLLEATINLMPILFMSLAVLLNLRNWIHYYIKIGEMTNIEDPQLS